MICSEGGGSCTLVGSLCVCVVSTKHKHRHMRVAFGLEQDQRKKI